MIPLFYKPSAYTGKTTKLAAVRAQSGIPQFIHTNETPKHISKPLESMF